jgi:RNA polymerase sigma-70 factor (ECF subfamily)
MEGYEYQGVPFSAWLYRIAHNLVANYHRDRDRHKLIVLDELGSLVERRIGPEGMLESITDQESVRKAIEKLHPDRQWLLVLKFGEELTNAEIGEIMGRSEGAIKSLYHRTLVALRKQMNVDKD